MSIKVILALDDERINVFGAGKTNIIDDAAFCLHYIGVILLARFIFFIFFTTRSTILLHAERYDSILPAFAEPPEIGTNKKVAAVADGTWWDTGPLFLSTQMQREDIHTIILRTGTEILEMGFIFCIEQTKVRTALKKGSVGYKK